MRKQNNLEFKDEFSDYFYLMSITIVQQCRDIQKRYLKVME